MAEKKKIRLKRYLGLKIALLLLIGMYVTNQFFLDPKSANTIDLSDLNTVNAILLKSEGRALFLERRAGRWFVGMEVVQPVSRVRSLLQTLRAIELIGDIGDTKEFDSLFEKTGFSVEVSRLKEEKLLLDFVIDGKDVMLRHKKNIHYIKFIGYQNFKFSKYAQTNAGFWLGKNLIKNNLFDIDSILCTDYRTGDSIKIFKNEYWQMNTEYDSVSLQSYLQYLGQVQFSQKINVKPDFASQIYRLRLYNGSDGTEYNFYSLLRDDEINLHDLVVEHEDVYYKCKYVQMDLLMKPLTYFIKNIE